MSSTGKATVVASPLLLLLIFSSQTYAYMDVTFDVKPISLPINWESKGNIVLCLTENSSKCLTYAMVMFAPSSLTENGKRITKRVIEPWIGTTMEVKAKEMSSNETDLFDVSHLAPRGATNASFDVFDVVRLAVSVKCSEYFHGAMCDFGCKPLERVFECDEEGGTVCINGKIGNLCNQTISRFNRKLPNAAALVDEKTNKKVMFDDGVIEDKERKMTVAVGTVAILAFGGVLVALTVARNRRRSSGHIRGQLDTLVEA
ncbi:hypothetical protein PRIPAC_97198 [Pristionchus pacificus]|uniref:DSL domain-containing protein n=1 Tax=Pristionchus pacificus TaxID=54126 RepID=A0A2A6CGR7_PRIPA|nr:hypothetical protein PRIPAC_97198 [Pristionchus pacificus]|eukprot:PDM77414.1 hypothetical protein PRIPAC_33144 [Pristionchus pacificus]